MREILYQILTKIKRIINLKKKINFIEVEDQGDRIVEDKTNKKMMMIIWMEMMILDHF